MYGIKILLSGNRLLTKKVRTAITSLINTQKNYSQKISSFDIKSQVKEDVVLYSFENPKLFIAINFFSAVHCVIWSYFGLFMFQTLKKTPVDDEKRMKYWGKIIDKEQKYYNILSALSVGCAVCIFAATLIYSVRSIRKIILHKGGKNLTFITYSLPGYNTLKIPLNNVSSNEHRTKAKKFIPISVKNKIFFYILDVRGEFYNPKLFDFTAGLKRNLKM